MGRVLCVGGVGVSQRKGIIRWLGVVLGEDGEDVVCWGVGIRKVHRLKKPRRNFLERGQEVWTP